MPYWNGGKESKEKLLFTTVLEDRVPFFFQIQNN